METLHSFIDRPQNTIEIPQDVKDATESKFFVIGVTAGLLRLAGNVPGRDYTDGLVLSFKLEGFEESVVLTLNMQSVQVLKRVIQEQEAREDVTS